MAEKARKISFTNKNARRSVSSGIKELGLAATVRNMSLFRKMENEFGDFLRTQLVGFLKILLDIPDFDSDIHRSRAVHAFCELLLGV